MICSEFSTSAIFERHLELLAGYQEISVLKGMFMDDLNLE